MIIHRARTERKSCIDPDWFLGFFFLQMRQVAGTSKHDRLRPRERQLLRVSALIGDRLRYADDGASFRKKRSYY